MLRSFAVGLALAIAASAASPAKAQFVGDVYFLQPSIAVPSGSAGDLDLAIFTGDKPFGATIVTLTFDPAKLMIENIADGTNGDDRVRLQSLDENGTVRIVVVNAASLERPFGSVAIARLRVRPTGTPSERIIIRSAVSRALFADGSAMRAGTGFDAEITIGQAQSTSSSGTLLLPDNSALAERARRLRPAGSEIRMMTRLNDGSIGEVRVRTRGTSTVRD